MTLLPMRAGLLWLVLLIALPAGVLAETRYVSDVLYVSLRDQPADPAKILRTLRSGTAVEVLERQGGYARVRTEDGLEGWVRAKFLVDEPIARDKLRQAEARLARLEQENQALREKLKALEGKLAEADKERKRLESLRQRLEGELARLKEVAARPAELAEENTQLKTRLVEAEKELAQLRSEVSTLRDQTRRDWFLAGAGVLLGGLLIGLIVPRIRWRRRSEWL